MDIVSRLLRKPVETEKPPVRRDPYLVVLREEVYRLVAFPYRKADALLYYMILRKRAPRSELAGLLWADSDSSAALKNLRHAVYTIRKGLGFDVFLSGASGVLELDPEASIRCDAAEFLEGGNPELAQQHHRRFAAQSRR